MSTAPGSAAAVLTDASGNFTFAPLEGGPYTIPVRHDGFIAQTGSVTLTRDTRADFPLLPVAPSGATARCKDRSWSFTTDRAAACARTGASQPSSAPDHGARPDPRFVAPPPTRLESNGGSLFEPPFETG